MKNTIKMSLLMGLLLAGSVQADLLFTVGGSASLWKATPKGQIDDSVKLDSDGLNLESTNGVQISLFFEHPVPFLPNLKIRRTNLEMSGDGTFNGTFLQHSYSEKLSSTLDLSHNDFTLYWGLPLPVPMLDINFGLTARNFDGKASAKGETTKVEVNENIKGTLPMLYAGAKFTTPVDVYVKGELNYIGFKDNSLLDYEATLGYNFPIPVVDLGVELGYRAFKIKTDKDTVDVATDAEISGAYFGISAAFGF